MDKQLYSIIKDIHSKYGKSHAITIASVRMISPFIKTADEMPEVHEVLEQSLDINIDELRSLFRPDDYEFEVQDIGNIGIEK